MQGGAKVMMDIRKGGRIVGYVDLAWDFVESRGGSWR